jgi:hypothetical protein
VEKRRASAPLLRKEARVWGKIGQFNGLMSLGSAAGLVTYVGWMQAQAANIETKVPEITDRKRLELHATFYTYLIVYDIHYPLEFLCLVVALCIQLRRVLKHTSHGYFKYVDTQDEEDIGTCHGYLVMKVLRVANEFILAKWLRAVIVTAVALCALGISASFVAAACDVKLATTLQQAAGACDAQGTNTNASLAFANQRKEISNCSNTAASVNLIIQAAVALIMFVANVFFMQIEMAMVSIVQRKLRRMMAQVSPTMFSGSETLAPLNEALAASTRQRRRFVLLQFVMTLTFLFRASICLFYAYVFIDSPSMSASCGACELCQSQRFLVRTWYEHTPEFDSISWSLSSTLPLLLSLILSTKFKQ